MVSLVKDPRLVSRRVFGQCRRLGHWLAVREFLSGAIYWVTGSPCDETCLSLEASNIHPGPTKPLALLIETSTRYVSRYSTAGITPPHTGDYLNMCTCLGLGQFCSARIIFYSLPDCKRTLEWFSIFPLILLYKYLVVCTSFHLALSSSLPLSSPSSSNLMCFGFPRRVHDPYD